MSKRTSGAVTNGAASKDSGSDASSPCMPPRASSTPSCNVRNSPAAVSSSIRQAKGPPLGRRRALQPHPGAAPGRSHHGAQRYLFLGPTILTRLSTGPSHTDSRDDRLLRRHVHILLDALPQLPGLDRQPLRGPGLSALRALLRLHGRQGRALAQEEQHDGAGAGFAG